MPDEIEKLMDAITRPLLAAIKAGIEKEQNPRLIAHINPSGSFSLITYGPPSDAASLTASRRVMENCVDSLEEKKIFNKGSLSRLQYWILEKLTEDQLSEKINLDADLNSEIYLGYIDQRAIAPFLTKLKNLGLKFTPSQDDYLCDFIRVFPTLCEKHAVTLLPGKTKWAERAVVGQSPDDEIIYEFNVSPEHMHLILMKESDYYAGYHYDASVLRLNQPNQVMLKENVICLFPVLALSTEGHIMLRNAGCNITDTLATQVSFLVKQYVDATIPTHNCYGHRSTPVVSDMLQLNPRDLLNAATCCLDIKQINTEVQEGLTEIHLPPQHRAALVEMTKEAKAIYSYLSAVGSDELDALQSVEIPVAVYLNKLSEILSSKLQRNVDKLEKLQHINPASLKHPYLKAQHPLEIAACEKEQAELSQAILRLQTITQCVNPESILSAFSMMREYKTAVKPQNEEQTSTILPSNKST